MCQEHVPGGKASGLAGLGAGKTLVQLFLEVAALEPVPVGKPQQFHFNTDQTTNFPPWAPQKSPERGCCFLSSMKNHLSSLQMMVVRCVLQDIPSLLGWEGLSC